MICRDVSHANCSVVYFGATSTFFFPPYLLDLVSLCLIILSLCFLVQVEQWSTLFQCLELFLSEVSNCFR